MGKTPADGGLDGSRARTAHMVAQLAEVVSFE